MTQIESPKIVKKKLFSPIWLLPIIALALAAWLGLKSIKEAGIEVRIHFPNATGIEIGKTLVKYQGLSVGKVIDIGIDKQLTGVNVDVRMDYRAGPFLNKNTKFWLVTPKASITGVEGLDALFSGNYIAIQPGSGNSRSHFEAEKSAPPLLPDAEGLVITLITDKLGSLDIGSLIFYRQIPVGKVIDYKLKDADKIEISAFINEKYASLVKPDSHFWNVSGVKIDASLSGIKVNTESLATILAGGISFSSSDSSEQAKNNQVYRLFNSEEQAINGAYFTLTTNELGSLAIGTKIVFRGIQIGQILTTELSDDGVLLSAKIDTPYAQLLSETAQFWVEGADISLAGIKHASRLITGDVIQFMPGTGDAKQQYSLLTTKPELKSTDSLKIKLTSEEHSGINKGAEVRYKQFAIGQIKQIKLNKSMTHVEYWIEIWPEFIPLVKKQSYFVTESALSIEADLEGLAVKTRDINTLTVGAISLIPSQKTSLISANEVLPLFNSQKQANQYYASLHSKKYTLISHDGADLNINSPVYYKKMQIGRVEHIQWNPKQENFAIEIAIENQFTSLVKTNTVFWRNSALSIDAGFTGVDIDLAPIAGALKGSISLGLLAEGEDGSTTHLYSDKALALVQAKPINLTFPASAKLTTKAAIKYQGHKVGEVEQVTLDHDLNTVSVDAYLYGNYAHHFTAKDTRYHIVDAQLSITGIKSPETLLTGPYIAVIPGHSDIGSTQFIGQLETVIAPQADWLTFSLYKANLGSVKVGTPIIYRGITIGAIDHYQLSADGGQVQLNAHVEARYQHLVNSSSQFWDISGIKVDLGLFSGAQIETGSIETVLAGGIGVATEKVTTVDNAITKNTRFELHPERKSHWSSWQPKQTAVTSVIN